MLLDISSEGSDYLWKLRNKGVTDSPKYIKGIPTELEGLTTREQEDRLFLDLYREEGPQEDTYYPNMVPEPVKSYMKQTIKRLFEAGLLVNVERVIDSMGNIHNLTESDPYDDPGVIGYDPFEDEIENGR